MSDTKEVFWQHLKVMAILLVFTAVAIALISSGKLVKGKALIAPSNAITSFAVSESQKQTVVALPTSTGSPANGLMKNLVYLLVLVGVLLAGSQARFMLGGRMPKTQDEEKLLQYIVLARENGFGEGDIIERLVMAGWESGQVERTMDSVNAKQPMAPPQRKL